MRFLLWGSRILFGLVFIFSGFVKLIDPLGSAYKFQDYFLAFDAPWLFPTALPLSILMSSFEMLIGVAVLFGLKMRYSAWGALIFMGFFTPLTLYIALTDPVPDCGCFGDAIIISNWDTFYKNIFILAAAILLFIYRKQIKSLWSETKDWYLIGTTAILAVGLSLYCLAYLPIIDFRPWKVGNDIREKLTPTEEVADTYLIFENQETGETREYPASDYPWDDPAWTAIWKYKDQRREIIQPFIEAPITNFFIEDEYGFDLTESILFEEEYQFIVVAYNLETTRAKAFVRKITPLALQAETQGYPLFALTAASLEKIDAFRHTHQTPFPFYQSDAIALKTIIRSNPGLLLLKDGVVVAKWPHRRIPTFDQISKEYLRSCFSALAEEALH
jgi:uncharacterized membrane protein YphA (DoxX/SURF4 family)